MRYWIDRYEVTNRQYAQFVNAGGYATREFWKHPVVVDGRELSWEESMARFVDATGRPGPSTWEMSRHPTGLEDFPVEGVSWYEAAAYAEFAAKSLPTNRAWQRARTLTSPQILDGMATLGNFSGRVAPVGTYDAMSASGTYDMAGNVREWLWNEVNSKQRLSLGGAADDPAYGALFFLGMPPLDRSANQGFRLVKNLEAVPEQALRPSTQVARDYRSEKPVSSEMFATFRRMYAYDRVPLKPTVESVDSTPELWREERLSFAAAYGGERITARLYLPKHASPPYQVVVYFPGAAANLLREVQFLDQMYAELAVRAGRAVLFPTYQDMYDRIVKGTQRSAVFQRQRQIQWYQDLGRAIDYVQTRPDLDSSKLAYFGFSHGPWLGAIFMALDPRIKLGLYLSGGFPVWRPPPELDPLNFAPHVSQPVLMVTGEHDTFSPVESSQRPFFDLLGTPNDNKKLVIVKGAGHVPPRQAFVGEVVDWLDRYFGRVDKLAVARR